MENTFFLRIEIVLLIISSIYCLYYITYNLWNKYSSSKRVRIIKTREEQLGESEVVNIVDSNHKYIKEQDEKNIETDDKVKIIEILKKEAVYYEKGDYSKAKVLIIEGLAIDKTHKPLNLELANIYNKEGEFKKSEYIYRELIENQQEDFDLLQKLGFILALQKKYKDSIRVYKEAYEKKQNDLTVVDILSDLTFEVQDYEGTVKFCKKYLNIKTRDIDKLKLLAFSYEFLVQREKAVDIYKKILETDPYNEEVLERLKVIEGTASLENVPDEGKGETLSA